MAQITVEITPRLKFSSVQSLSHVRLFVTPWIAAGQASLSHHQLLEFTQTHIHRVSDAIQPCDSPSSPPPPAFNLYQHQCLFQWVSLRARWPKFWSFSFSISPSKKYSGLISLGLTGLISLLSKGLSWVFSNTTSQKHQFFGTQPSIWSNSYIHTWLLEKS